MRKLFARVESGFPESLEVGAGTVRAVRGYCFHAEQQVCSVAIAVGDQRHSLQSIREPRADVFRAYAGFDEAGGARVSGFWGAVPLAPGLAGTTQEIVLEVTTEDGQTHVLPQGACRFQAATRLPVEAAAPHPEAGPLIAICLASYDPDLDSFKRQLDSIIAQDYRNWVLIVNDDGSPQDKFESMAELCASDPRVHVVRNATNLGFYGNFEAALKRVPVAAAFVALSDQDDYWYPDKLSRCLAEFDVHTQLVYSDMRIVTESGEVVSDSYWSRRRNNYTDLDVVLIANTITGAASLFRAELLEKILPFPQRIGDLFHDHWIGLVAMVSGPLRYVDAPLYDYVQYGSNVIGHCDFAPVTVKRRLDSLVVWAGRIAKAVQKRLRRSAKPGKLKSDVYFLRDRLVDIYANEYRRLQLESAVLVQRMGMPAGRDGKALRIFSGTPMTVLRLLAAHGRIMLGRSTTNDAEIRLLASYMAFALNRLAFRWARRWLAGRNQANRARDAQNNLRRVEFLERKMAPLRLAVNADEPTRINILVPEIGVDHLFGGYIGKFSFARRLAERGDSVRLVVVDPGEFDAEAWRRGVSGDRTLGPAFRRVQTADCQDRSVALKVSPRDLFVATTWWTAFIAHEAVKALGAERFLYLVQEYEPFTFPMGTYAALAAQSYALPHYALFSSGLLQDYFAARKIGVFAGGLARGRRESSYFENAIVDVAPDRAKMERREGRRLLFYARSDEHAARNMFEVGVMALNRAIDAGAFGEGWEFWGMGTTYGDLSLSDGRVLRMVGKLSLAEYRDLLGDFDLGLSLMYTPHPSLVPLEMAAAGMRVVTTACLNKGPDELRAISSNIDARPPTVAGVAEGLQAAVEAVGDVDDRIAGSAVRWARSWDEAFPDQLLAEVTGWLRPGGKRRARRAHGASD
jgi:glycosyltransferase involved in cell wall biosynthesis